MGRRPRAVRAAAGRRPWQYRASREGALIREVRIPSPFQSEQQVVDLIAAAITPHTRGLAFCHVTRGGHLYPVKSLCETARSQGLVTLVDGAQAVGMFPIDLADLGCDAYSASLHKWFLGPVGTGFLYVRESARDRIRSLFAFDATREAPAFDVPGTADFPVRAALEAALRFNEAIGVDSVARRTRYLSDYLRRRVGTLPGVTLLSGPTPATSCPGSIIFEKQGIDAMALIPVMDEQHRIHIDEHQRDSHNAIRVSTHIYNTTAEIDRLVDVLAAIEM